MSLLVLLVHWQSLHVHHWLVIDTLKYMSTVHVSCTGLTLINDGFMTIINSPLNKVVQLNPLNNRQTYGWTVCRLRVSWSYSSSGFQPAPVSKPWVVPLRFVKVEVQVVLLRVHVTTGLCNAVSACCEVRASEIILLTSQHSSWWFRPPAMLDLMMVDDAFDDGWWCFWWWLMVIDDGSTVLKTPSCDRLVQPHACPSAESARRPWSPTWLKSWATHKMQRWTTTLVKMRCKVIYSLMWVKQQ